MTTPRNDVEPKPSDVIKKPKIELDASEQQIVDWLRTLNKWSADDMAECIERGIHRNNV